jgi:hypothetical protein
MFLLYNTRVHERQVVLSSHDATQNQVMITYINFYDTELRSEKVVTIQNMQSVTYFLKMCGQMAVSSNQNAMQVSVQLHEKVKQSTSFVRSGPGSAVGIATAYGLGGPGIESRWARDFSHLCRPALRPTQPPVQWVPDLTRG